MRSAGRRLTIWWTGVVLVAIAAAVASAVALTGSGSPAGATGTHHDVATASLGGPPGPEGIPLEPGSLLAAGTSAAGGQTVGRIQCNPTEQVVYHVHTHLSVYANGVLRPVPAGIGIVAPIAEQTAEGPFYSATTCYYWLHVHAQDGVIHIESPSVHSYALGQFFAIWNQPLTASRVGPAKGRLTVFVDGRLYRGDPRAILLGSHEDIQIDVGTPIVPPQKVDWSNTGL